MKNDRQRRRESSDSHVEVTDINNCYWALPGRTMSSNAKAKGGGRKDFLPE